MTDTPSTPPQSGLPSLFRRRPAPALADRMAQAARNPKGIELTTRQAVDQLQRVYRQVEGGVRGRRLKDAIVNATETYAAAPRDPEIDVTVGALDELLYDRGIAQELGGTPVGALVKRWVDDPNPAEDVMPVIGGDPAPRPRPSSISPEIYETAQKKQRVLQAISRGVRAGLEERAALAGGDHGEPAQWLTARASFRTDQETISRFEDRLRLGSSVTDEMLAEETARAIAKWSDVDGELVNRALRAGERSEGVEPSSPWTYQDRVVSRVAQEQDGARTDSSSGSRLKDALLAASDLWDLPLEDGLRDALQDGIDHRVALQHGAPLSGRSLEDAHRDNHELSERFDRAVDDAVRARSRFGTDGDLADVADELEAVSRDAVSKYALWHGREGGVAAEIAHMGRTALAGANQIRQDLGLGAQPDANEAWDNLVRRPLEARLQYSDEPVDPRLDWSEEVPVWATAEARNREDAAPSRARGEALLISDDDAFTLDHLANQPLEVRLTESAREGVAIRRSLEQAATREGRFPRSEVDDIIHIDEYYREVTDQVREAIEPGASRRDRIEAAEAMERFAANAVTSYAVWHGRNGETAAAISGMSRSALATAHALKTDLEITDSRPADEVWEKTVAWRVDEAVSGRSSSTQLEVERSLTSPAPTDPAVLGADWKWEGGTLDTRLRTAAESGVAGRNFADGLQAVDDAVYTDAEGYPSSNPLASLMDARLDALSYADAADTQRTTLSSPVAGRIAAAAELETVAEYAAADYVMWHGIDGVQAAMASEIGRDALDRANTLRRELGLPVTGEADEVWDEPCGSRSPTFSKRPTSSRYRHRLKRKRHGPGRR